MKKISTILILLCIALFATSQTKPMNQAKPVSDYPVPAIDYSVLDGMEHPRLFISQKDITRLRKAVKESPNPDFLPLHKSVMETASKYVRENKILVYKKDVSGRRILSVSRDALARIFYTSYAYIITGDTQYSDLASFIINTVCDFPDWNPSHYLDTAEMGLAVAIGYDWLYDVLDEKTRLKAGKALYERVICTTLDTSDKYASTRCTSPLNNWNQVCNAGVVSAAIAVFDQHPDEGRKIIDRAIPYNSRAVEHMYAPDGVYPEGSGYWSYGTSFQIALNTMLTRVFGTDFGLSDLPGFSKTGRFMMFAQSNIGQSFDFADTGGGGSTFPQAWYFAERFDDPDCLYLIHKSVQGKNVRTTDRLYPLYLIYAARYNAPDIPEPSERLYHGGGNIPIVIARTGWKSEDAFLGIKGGLGGYNHGHLDVGAFVFEADGVRWASEFHTVGGYSTIEKELKRIGGGSLFNSKPDSWRWKIFSYSNFDHSTLTVNGKIHDPYAFCDFKQTYDTREALGATIDMTPLFGGDLVRAERTVLIKKGDSLEITDIVEAPSDRDAVIQFTFVSDAKAAAGRKSITLTSGELARTLKVKGAKVEFMTWSTEPRDYPNKVNSTLRGQKNKSKSGYTYTVPAGETLTVVTTLK